MKFTCTECRRDINYDHVKSTHYFDAENYVVGFKWAENDGVICDECYARNDK